MPDLSPVTDEIGDLFEELSDMMAAGLPAEAVIACGVELGSIRDALSKLVRRVRSQDGSNRSPVTRTLQ